MGTRTGATREAAQPDADEILEFMSGLGQAYLGCGEQSPKVELLLQRVATAYGMFRSRVVAFPTVLFITLHDGSRERVTIADGPAQTLRLDQIADVYALGAEAQRGAVPPRDGLRRLNTIYDTKWRFGSAGAIAGHTILTLGLTMLLESTPGHLAVAVILGTMVGVLKLLNRDRPLLAVPMPVVAATLVSTLVYFSMRHGLSVNPLHALIPPLVTFLPGSMLTLGMVELAYGDMVSGSSRLVTGFIQLVLLAFGLAVGAILVGGGHANFPQAPPAVLVWWVEWAGVIVFGIGVYLHFSAPRNSLPWLLFVLLMTHGAQQLGVWLFGNNEIGGFFGMLVATPLGYVIQLQFNGPPAMVTFLPSFWLLVPGAVGLLSVTRMMSDRSAGIDGLTVTVAAFTSIALGTLMGASIYRWITERIGSWHLQIGGAGQH
jgi:uncharacterized membrane protein YjjP (DUF1212 family)